MTTELLVKLFALVFASGMLYSNIKSSGEQTRRDLDSMKSQMEKRLERMEDYLLARQRNGL